ncbi:UNVERIFIED_CONTAM: hypothetical protein PYX00_008630 [Menopon gallinae]|uniref:Uncharacterized protein n=1 Tax=Menopon gallinae TaxID=328185 RepID=A0AAW2HP45_9NEOP
MPYLQSLHGRVRVRRSNSEEAPPGQRHSCREPGILIRSEEKLRNGLDNEASATVWSSMERGHRGRLAEEDRIRRPRFFSRNLFPGNETRKSRPTSPWAFKYDLRPFAMTRTASDVEDCETLKKIQ